MISRDLWSALFLQGFILISKTSFPLGFNEGPTVAHQTREGEHLLAVALVYVSLEKHEGSLGPDDYFFALTFAQRALCAAAIFARDFADILRRMRLGLPPL
jgi:hypothetical protein